ncbi:ABC transporter ATP-binding protein [Nocardioides marmoribigeumensis]|uniref:Thiamine transport system ATP-binding protein n=1 Tax=Nocardioides marmoribigeumensis TaxID=433649 RepID=A0ABU2BUR3_9ACTN|nr:ABC transporter ATP-binding protein [Nocardioides marmoribigeumensis]MDR7361769.1 thiamine transport system ATP-binding protein [Nocardioides marmoribigeumensis]
MSALQVDHVTVRFGDVTAVDDVSLDVTSGQVCAVLGPSGSGKSTLLRAVAGLEPLTCGRVAYDGHDLRGVPPHRRGFALMFQDGQLFPHLTVAENVAYALRVRRRPRAERVARVAELLDLVGLTGYDARLPAELSGGELQRVALARSLAASPRLLLLDEPLASLDRHLTERLADDLATILREAGTTALMVTHDAEEAFAVADRMAVLRGGRLVQAGGLDEVWRAPVDATTAGFLGYATVLAPDRARALAGLAGVPLAPGGEALALRRSALRVSDGGPVRATVTALRSASEQVRLRVEVAAVGELDAVASWAQAVRVGDEVTLGLDPSRTAAVPAG